MKKIFLLIAFTGIVGASSANTFRQDDKKKAECKHEHHDCSKHAKGECHKGMSDSTKHECKHHDKKDCCKKGSKPAETPAK